MANNVSSQRKDLDRRECFSICLAETRIAVIATYPSDATTELVTLLGLSEATKGENMRKASLFYNSLRMSPGCRNMYEFNTCYELYFIKCVCWRIY